MTDFLIKISTPADLSGAAATVTSFEQIEQQAGKVGAASTNAADSVNRLAQAAAHTPNASLESLATSARNVAASAEAARRPMKQLSEESESFFERFKGGLAMGFGIGSEEKIIGGLEEIGHSFVEMVHRGVEGNAELQTSVIGLGATLRSVQPEKFLSFDAAQREGATRIDMLRDKANALGVDMHSLVEAYSANVGALVEGGVTNPLQQMMLVATVAQAEMSKGVTGMQALKDSIDIFNGRAGNIPVAKELRLLSEELKEASEKGQLYQYVMGKLPGYQEAAAAGADSFKGSLATITNELEKLEQTASKPVFDKLLEILNAGRGPLGGAPAQGVAIGLGNILGGTLDSVQNLGNYLESHPAVARLLGVANSLTVGGIVAEHMIGAVKDGTGAAEINAETKQVADLRDEVANAKDAASIAKARKDLENEVAEAAGRVASAQGEAKAQAGQYLTLLREIERTFAARVGSAPEDRSVQEARAKQDAAAYAKYNARPAAAEYDPAEANAADKREKSAETLAKTLEKTWGFSAATALIVAKETIARNENTKAAAALNKELDGIVAKQERHESAADLAVKVQSAYGGIIGQLPNGSRAGRSDNPTDGDIQTVTSAVAALPEGDKKATDAKKELVDRLKELIRLQDEYNRATEREGRDALDRAGNLKQTQDTIQDEKAETAILAARGRGQKDVADALEKQRDILHETTRLQSAGVEHAEALQLATERINAANAAADEKQEQHDARRSQRHAIEHDHPRRPGERDTFTIHGYRDGDGPGGGLHTGGLSTGNLGGGGGSNGAADALAAAPTYVPSFKSKPLFAPGLDPLAQVFAGGPLASIFGASSASIGFGSAQAVPDADKRPPGGTASEASGGNDKLATAAQKAAASASKTEASAERAAAAIEKLGGLFQGITARLEKVEHMAETALSRSENRS